ncbi:MAG: T9SS type A sorting domain-containing protein [Paludibacter sp.]
MRNRIRITGLVLLLCICLANLQAQDSNLLLKFKNGTTSQIKIKTIKNLTFATGMTRLMLIDGSNAVYASADIQSLYFETLVNDVPDVSKVFDMFVYPNPTNGVISFKGLGEDPVAVRIYNMSGVLMFSARINSSVQSVNIGFLPRGIYLVNMNGQLSKLIKL